MMNFRYHLVSLIAVFAALAIGVVLGAGPLQTRLASSLAPQTPSATVSVQDLTDVRKAADVEAAGLRALAQSVLPGTLSGVAVTTIALPGVSADDVKAVRDMLTLADATLVGSASLTDNWEMMSMSQYRQTLATPLATHMSQLPTDATDDAVIGYAIVEVLTTTGSQADLVKEILTDESTPIMTIDEDPAGATQAIVVIGARSGQASSGANGAQSDTRLTANEAWLGLARAITSAPRAGVILADASQDGSMASVIRSAHVAVTTVDSPGTTLGALNVARALPDASSVERAYGVGGGADSVLADPS